MTRPIEDIERELTEALDKAVARGMRVIRGDNKYAIEDNCGCAIQLWANKSRGYRRKAEEDFGWSGDEPYAFFGGWDNDERRFGDEMRKHPEIAALGRRLAAKYVDGRAEGAK